MALRVAIYPRYSSDNQPSPAPRAAPGGTTIRQDLWSHVQTRLATMREAAGANNPDRPKF
jgi:hypothetical protein